MTAPLSIAVSALAAYLAGSLPFGFLVAKLGFGRDIRREGSGNIGATNVGRVFGAKWGMLVLVLDALKGMLPVWLLPRLFSSEAGFVHLLVLCGVATIVGHMFPCWLGFRGGKGVATALGVIAVLSPWGTLAAFGTFAATFAVFRIVSLASILATLAFAGVELWLLAPDAFSNEKWSLATFSLLVPALIIVRHRANIARLVKGEEPRFAFKKKPAAERAGDA